MSFDRRRILLRINYIVEQLKRLKVYEDISFEEYLNDFEKRLTIERLLELIIQAAIDINKHIVRQGLGLKFPQESKESFTILGQNNILTEELAIQLVKSAGLRNILAHEYLEIDNSTVYQSISQALVQYPLYIQQITAYLDSLEQEND